MSHKLPKPPNYGTPQGTTWTFEWTGEGKKYLIHDASNNYILIENDKVSLTDRDTALANPITVASREGKYSFINEKNNQALNIYGDRGFGRWGYSETNSDFLMTLQDPSNLKQPGTITTADTNGILQINLFDYGPEDQLDKEANNNSSPYSGGINSGHTLKFFSYGKNTGTGVNDFTGAGNGPQTGIVADQLVGNYPVVASNPNESLDYLFGGVTNTNVDPHPGLNHLFTKDENGYYHYNSDQNYAYLNGTDFKVYSKTFPEEGADEQYFGVGFFPFNDYDEYYNCIHGKDGFNYWDPHRSGTDKSGHYDHHFGMSLIGNFIMPPDGQYNGKDVTFQFSGDDDLWVFVDGVLIMDIGGVHNPVSGEINFTTGEVTVHGAAQENFKEKYKRLTGNDWDDSDFSNHDFRVFYMERGGMYSNLEVTFNLPLTPKTETNDFQFDKVSSENESLKLSGAEFSLFTDPSCNDPLTLASVPVKATSSDDGTVSFRHVPHGTYYMKETAYPQGYQAKNPEEVFTVEVGATGATITLSGEPVTKVTNQPKKIDVEVEKVWTNGVVPQGASIEIVLGRYKLVEDPNAPGTATLVIKDSYSGLPSGSAYHVTYIITGPDGYTKTITKSYTDASNQIEEPVEVPATVAGSQYTVTKQVRSISYHNINNQSGTANVTVSKNGTGQAQFNQTTFTRNAYRVRIYAVNSSDPNNLYSENYYPAGSALSVGIKHKNHNWGFFTFTISSNTGWNSSTYSSDGQQQFTSYLNQDTDLVLKCSSSEWRKPYDWIQDPYITGATPVQAASAARVKASAMVALGQTASDPTLPEPPQNTLYELDEDYAANPDKIILSNGTWTGKAEGLDASNEYGPYQYYIAEVNESGMPEGTTMTISDELTSDGSAQVLTVTNEVPTGYLQINKSVTHNGVAPNATQAAALAGTYKFYVYTDPQCSEAHRVKQGQEDLELTVTIGANGAASSSTPVKLPAGDYWIEEQTPSQTGVTPEENRIHVKVTADNTTSAAAHADFVNNKEESNNPDELAIELEKTFTGLSRSSEIPDGFQATLKYTVPGASNNPVTVALTGSTQGHVTCIKSTDGMTWHWKVTHIPSNATGFGISESNYDVDGYTRITKINGNVVSDPSSPTGVTVLVPTVTFEHFTRDYTTPDNNKNFTVLDGTDGDPLQILLVRMTSHATVIVSQKTLGIATRTAIENALSANGWKIPGDEGAQAQWVNNVVYFSHEEQGDQFSYGGKTIYFKGNTVKIPHNASSHEARVDVVYKTESAENSFVLENAYTNVPIEFDVLKVEAGKEDTTKLPGAVFELRQLMDEAPTGNGTLEYVKGDDNKVIVTTKTTDPEGRLTFKDLTNGYYEITEAKAPAGYILPADLVFYVKVEGGAVTRLRKGNGKPSTWTDASDDETIRFTPASAATEDDPAQNAEFRVSNEPGQPLPSAGGPGTGIFVTVGTSLMIGALLMLVRRRRMA